MARVRLRIARVVVALALVVAACRDDRALDADGSGRIADVEGTLGAGASDRAPDGVSMGARSGDSLMQSLTYAAGGVDGQAYRVRSTGAVGAGGVILGHVRGGGNASRDSAIVPTHDLNACAPFTQRLLPSSNDGVGNAVVWLVGVAAGPPDTTARRTSLRLSNCQLEPRVQRVAVGGTIMVTSRDAMMTRLRFVDASGTDSARAMVLLNDAGQVVPVAGASATPGLVEVRDDLHPWVRAWIAVSPHPFVAVTTADGNFQFDAVPPGRYTLVVWSEVLGLRSRQLRVTDGVETRLDVKY